VYEDVGVPPHIRLNYLGRKGREEGKDPMLERVLKLVGGWSVETASLERTI